MRSLAAVIVVVMSGACGGDDATGPADAMAGDDSAHAFCVQETNRYRGMNGKAARSVMIIQDFGR